MCYNLTPNSLSSSSSSVSSQEDTNNTAPSDHHQHPNPQPGNPDVNNPDLNSFQVPTSSSPVLPPADSAVGGHTMYPFEGDFLREIKPDPSEASSNAYTTNSSIQVPPPPPSNSLRNSANYEPSMFASASTTDPSTGRNSFRNIFETFENFIFLQRLVFFKVSY